MILPKDFWTRTLVFTNKDDNLTKGHIRYLESRLIKISLDAKRAKLQNGTSSDYGILPESDIADMDYFVEQIKLLLPVLGFTFALPLVTLVKEPTSQVYSPEIQIESPLFTMQYAGAEAYAQEINNEFIVFQDSTIRKKENESLRSAIKNLRTQLVIEGKLIQNDDEHLWTMTENLPFNSPSGAAVFVRGTSLNGRQTWFVKETGQTYEHWQGHQLLSVGED